MKKIKFNLSIILFSLFIGACAKDDSVVSGRISYVGAISGIEYKGNGADVFLYYGSNTSGTPIQTTKANSEGDYSFSNLAEGMCSVKATIRVNAINYSGTSSVYVSGKDLKTLNLKLQ
jgi:hypothetical protein